MLVLNSVFNLAALWIFVFLHSLQAYFSIVPYPSPFITHKRSTLPQRFVTWHLIKHCERSNVIKCATSSHIKVAAHSKVFIPKHVILV